MSFTIETGKETGLVQGNVIPRPLILCQIQAVDGDMCYLSTTPDLGANTKSYGGNTYLARLKSNVIDQIQAQSAQGYDIPGSVRLEIADGDFFVWLNHANAHQWRGGTLTVLFVLWDVPSNTYSTNSYTWTFILDKPNIDDSGNLTVAAQSRQSMTRLSVPNFARQNRCGNQFPATAAQRLDGLTNPTSPYYGCGYSADLVSIGGVGNTTTPNLTNSDGSPLTDASGLYVMCDFSRSCGPNKGTRTQGCMARLGNYAGTLAADGDITKDQSGRSTARFTGDTWVASVGWSGKQYTNPSAGTQYGFNTPNPATGAQHYPIGYGTQWVDAIVCAPAGTPNDDRAEADVCMAPIGPAVVKKVLVGGIEVTENNSDTSFTYYTRSSGGRTGVVNGDKIYDSQGDPHGSRCYIEVVVPQQLSQPGSIPSVQALVQFPQCLHAKPIASASASGGPITITLPSGIDADDIPSTVYVKGNALIPDGAYQVSGLTIGPPGTITLAGTSAAGTGTGGGVFYFPAQPDSAMIEASTSAVSANPVWALMDLLAMWGPFTVADFDVATWYSAAQVCAAQISYTDINGNTQTHARYRCSFVLTDATRRTLAKAVLGIRNSAGLLLARNPANGLLQCFVEQTLADQQPAPISGSNYNTPVASLTAANTSANGYLAYLFDGNGSIEKGTLKISGRTLNDTPNTVSFPFQDAANAWVQDTITVVDPDGYIGSGNQEIQDQFDVLGVDNFDDGQRRSNVELAKAMYGNSRFDAGGTDLYSLRTSVKAAHLAGMLGAICGIRYDQLGL